MYFTSYDYQTQQGKKYNEIYTFDREWHESSFDDPQRVTGINRENFWISKYGEDFLKYRAVGYQDQLWRRPNQMRSGGIRIPDTRSSPMEYTNGSHPRRYYVGNRYVVMCGHCIFSVGLETGHVIFYDTNGTAITYDIENYDPNIPSDGRAWSGRAEDRHPAYIINPFTNDATFGDGAVIRLTTDPSDDGIPSLKQAAGTGVRNKKGNKLYQTGLGVLFPVYTGESSLGGRFGGNDRLIWSGDSGTILFHDTFDGWLPDITGSGRFDTFYPALRELTSDDDYQILESSSKSYYLMETLPEDSLGITIDGIQILKEEGVFAEVTAKNIFGRTKKETDVLPMTSTIVDGDFFDDGREGFLISVDGLTKAYATPFSREVSNGIPRLLIQPQSLAIDNESQSGLPITSSSSFKMSNGTIIGGTEQDGPSIFSDNNYEFSSFVGETFEMIIQGVTELGVDRYSTELYCIGFTGMTGSGLSYNSDEFFIDSGITIGTVFDQDLPIEYRWTVVVKTPPSDILAVNELGGPTFDISSVSDRTGDVLTAAVRIKTPFLADNSTGPNGSAEGAYFSKDFTI